MQRVNGFVTLLLGICILWQGSYLSLGSFQRPGPGFFPILVAIVIIILSLFSVISSIKKGGRQDSPRGRFTTIRVLIVFASLLAYFVFLDYLGFILVSFSLMLFLFVATEPQKWRTAILKAVITTGLAYLLFEVLLSGNLPKGVIGV